LNTNEKILENIERRETQKTDRDELDELDVDNNIDAIRKHRKNCGKKCSWFKTSVNTNRLCLACLRLYENGGYKYNDI